jgi:hypothetical protein
MFGTRSMIIASSLTHDGGMDLKKLELSPTLSFSVLLGVGQGVLCLHHSIV